MIEEDRKHYSLNEARGLAATLYRCAGEYYDDIYHGYMPKELGKLMVAHARCLLACYDVIGQLCDELSFWRTLNGEDDEGCPKEDKVRA